jgi:protease IV
MKSFLKYTLATIVGIVVTGLLFMLIFFGIMGAILSKGDTTVDVRPQSILKMKLNYEIRDRSPKNPFENIDFQTFKVKNVLGLNDILANIEKAKKDDDVAGIYMDLSYISAGMATIEEIRNALIDFKESDKFILCYSDIYLHKSYYLASVADSIYLNPTGWFYMTGLSSQLMFFKETLDKLGIEPQIIRRGKFKSAVEPFTRDQMSRENRKQTEAYLRSLWNHMAEEIADHRNIPQDTLNMLINNLAVNDAQSARKHGLVDGLRYKDEIKESLKRNSEVDDKPRLVSLGQYNGVPAKKSYRGLAKDKIAVIYAMGQIMTGEGQEGDIGSERITRAIRKARKDSSIKAIVFRINSGGGSTLASDIIWREMDLAQKEKPVVASFGDLAASGGYYIAVPADTILASPNTLTGSIGVFGLFFNAKKLLNDKLGIHIDVARTHQYADFGTPFRSLKTREKKVMEHLVDDIYDTFITRVARGRNMKTEKVQDVAQGRVWSGMDARHIGLIDKYGGLTDAVELAAEMAETSQYRTVGLPKQKDPFQQFMERFSREMKNKVLKQTLGGDARYYQHLKEAVSMEGIQARMPYTIEVN